MRIRRGVKVAPNPAAAKGLALTLARKIPVKLLERYPDDDTKYLRGDGQWAPAGSPLSKTDFLPAGDLVSIASTDPTAPTDIFTYPALTFDGTTDIRIEFYASAVDIDQRGKARTAAVLLELYDGATGIGIVFDYNVTNLAYGSIPCFIATYDTPSAGAHTYSIKGWREGEAGGAVGAANVYGTGLSTPHVTRGGFGAIFVA